MRNRKCWEMKVMLQRRGVNKKECVLERECAGTHSFFISGVVILAKNH